MRLPSKNKATPWLMPRGKRYCLGTVLAAEPSTILPHKSNEAAPTPLYLILKNCLPAAVLCPTSNLSTL